MFNIRFIKSGLGEIEIDDFKETFESDHQYWSTDEYESHWEDAKLRLRNGQKAMFLTSLSEPSYSNFFRAWVCYPMADELVFQEQLVLLDQLSSPFDINNPHKHVGEYESYTEEGDEISEWRISANIE